MAGEPGRVQANPHLLEHVRDLVGVQALLLHAACRVPCKQLTSSCLLWSPSRAPRCTCLLHPKSVCAELRYWM